MTAPAGFARPAASLTARVCETGWAAGPPRVTIGKDVLELVSSSMYIDPITVYREYVQNAADAVDEARSAGRLRGDDPGRVDVELDPATRSVRLRDNGIGLASESFAERLMALGASKKRGTGARGLRGVGRLAGLGYCRELIFRSRAEGEPEVSELRWDCLRLKASLRSADFSGKLSDLIRDGVSIRRMPAGDHPKRFFEVELKGVVRHRDDRLLSPHAVADYLAQVAPVPFAPCFRFGAEIVTALRPHVALGDLEVRVSGLDEPVYRPHRDVLEINEARFDAFTDLELHEIPGVDGGIAAIAWVLHHGYQGAIPSKNLKGLRLRTGNLQVGDHALLEELFPEARFNAWSIGEVHVVDRRLLPNGRRDHFEQSVHLDNLLNHLSPITRDIARRCRTSSIRRKWLREFDLHNTAARERTAIVAQRTLPAADRDQLTREVERSIAAMERIAGMDSLDIEADVELRPSIKEVRIGLRQALGRDDSASPLDRLPPNRRSMYEHLFGLIYECSTNRVAAKALVDRILLKIS